MSTLPTITSFGDMLQKLQQWQRLLNPAAQNVPVTPRSPFNFVAQGGIAGTTGVLLTWERVPHADGYEIQRSEDGDFSSVGVSVVLDNVAQTSYFDSIGVAGAQRYYRIRATAGTVSQPHTVKGTLTATIASTSGSGSTTYDTVSNGSGKGSWNPPGGSGGSGGRSGGRPQGF